MKNDDIKWDKILDDLGYKDLKEGMITVTKVLAKCYKVARAEGLTKEEAINMLVIMYWRPSDKDKK